MKAHPHALGAKACYSLTESPVRQLHNPRGVAHAVVAQHLVIMTKITNRALGKYQLMAENTARGRLP